METTITFALSKKDKELISQHCLREKLSCSAYIRHNILKLIKNEMEMNDNSVII